MKNVFNSLRLQWLNINMLNVLAVFISTNIAAIVIWQLEISHLAMPLVLGIIATALSEQSNRLTGRFKDLILMLIAFGTVSLISQFFLTKGWIFVPLLTIITFIVVMLGAVGGRYSKIAFCTLLVAVYTALVYTPNVVWYINTTLILLGTLIYSFISLLIYLCLPNRATQESLASYFDSLGNYLQQKSTFFDFDDINRLSDKKLALARANTAVMRSFDEVREVLFSRLDQQHRHFHTQKMLRYYLTGQEIWERTSSSHSQYQDLLEEFQHTDLVFRLRRLLELQAIECQYIAKALRHNLDYKPNFKMQRVLKGLQNSLQYHQKETKASFYQLSSMIENLKNITLLFEALYEENICNDFGKNNQQTYRLLSENISGIGNIFYTIKKQCYLGSELFRHAIRLSIVVFVCCSIVQIFHLELGYWILLTAILVCKPNYSATKKRLVQRILGTLLGVFVGLSLRYLSPTLEAQLGIIVATSSLFFFFMERKYSYASFFITIQVLVSFDVIGLGKEMAILPRILDTFIGAGIAWFAVSFLWADWRYLNLRQNLEETLKSSSLYLRHIMAQLQFGYRDHFGYRLARRMAYHNVAKLSTTVSAMQEEPKKYKNSLAVAPQLLELNYTLLSYISALGVYRKESDTINHQFEYSTVFFQQGKFISRLLDSTYSETKQRSTQLNDLITQLQYLEQDYLDHEKDKARLLVQQLSLIVQLLPELDCYVNKL
ncbi:YccS family putative transporter [Pasteurella atlantica]|uniref:YccS family putative transporter n=2 Tax=Pasteurellaceae TaxID=712 RepID=A0ACC6HKK7_9PAST|nr:YccS family putative transporter [Pasteurella atlantica]MDP8033117.1 YccS family putative transporter [Pasteurella atlantica]MDP8035054.1 YccS family putative transporter [Pasteurella atlantica]MDP8036986.1 YccS family putative transporter [Pasteurella atlantica]MDP8047488.1 YccS family putative transporter [Pasteurella atlantica]MDP8049157.1 YccS family putative transporter [Pasteurella atlantica]